MSAVLVIEDARDTATEIGAELTRLGFSVGIVADGAEGLERAVSEKWDALIVDRMLPSIDGLSLVRALRARNVTTPALILSALDQVGDRINGLRAGGDDYLVKPFALGELAARLEALLRRPLDGKQTTLHIGTLELDLVERKARRGCRMLDLLAREFQLLEYMARRAEQTVTREMILADVFGYRFELKSNLVDVHMGRLRRKLDLPGDSPSLVNIRGVGFVLRAPE
ncbi:MAG: response regulator transcription factor [Methylovirgula sp.]